MPVILLSPYYWSVVISPFLLIKLLNTSTSFLSDWVEDELDFLLGTNKNIHQVWATEVRELWNF